MVASHLIVHSLLYAAIFNGYLLLMMISTSPRVWGYTDYPEAIKAKVPAQTSEEKRLALMIAIPWMVFALGFPVYSTLMLKGKLGGEILYWTAFLNVLLMVLLATLGDLVVLDWIIISKITPDFVVIPGTAKSDYKDFSHHFRAHARAAAILLVLCILIAAAVALL